MLKVGHDVNVNNVSGSELEHLQLNVCHTWPTPARGAA